MDLAAPGSGFRASPFDEGLELLQIGLDASTDKAELLSDVLDDPLRVVVDDRRHPGLVRPQRLEADDAGVLAAARATPGDMLIGDLIGDRGVPLLLFAGDRCLPVESRVVKLTHLLDAIHELLKLLELRPLVVSRTHWDVDVDRPLEACH